MAQIKNGTHTTFHDSTVNHARPEVPVQKLAINVAIRINQLPRNLINDAYSLQLIRSSSSPGTNYRAACRGKSAADYLNKLKIVEEELDETMYFLELIEYFNEPKKQTIKVLIAETNELLAITVASIKKIRTNEKDS